MDRRKRWKYERDRGVIHMVDAAPTAALLKQLPLSYAEVARRVGVSASCIEKIAGGKRTKIHAVTARKVSALQGHQSDLKVPQIGTQRRLRALLRVGWSHSEMRSRYGIRTAVLLHQKCNWVYLSTHQVVVRMYDELSMQLGPSKHSIAWAIKQGYPGPLAWDDDEIDDPTAYPRGMDRSLFCNTGRHFKTEKNAYYPPGRLGRRHCRDCQRERKRRAREVARHERQAA